ncbi:MAG: hypothetical protein OHK0046_39760 [Anaerolineae bacterium]
MVAAAPVQTLTFTRSIAAPVETVYRYFTNRDDVCDWLCFDADIHAVPEGYMLLIWREGHHVYGRFRTVEENKQLVLSWQAQDEALASLLTVTFEDQNDQTRLMVEHSGLEDTANIASYQAQWDASLDNLKSVIETGANLTFTNRVLIGIYPAEFTPESAEALGIPVQYGVRVGNVIPNYSAQLVGLQTDDVITAIDGVSMENATIFDVTGKKKPGDVVDVEYYRGSTQHTVKMTLKGYPVPPIPTNFADMAAYFAGIFDTSTAVLTELASTYPESAFDHKPDDAPFNGRQILAHLILRQRHMLDWLGSYLQGPRRSSDYTQVLGRLQAIIDTRPTVPTLLDELKTARAETIALVRNFPAELETNKSALWWIVFDTSYLPAFFQQNADALKHVLEAA